MMSSRAIILLSLISLFSSSIFAQKGEHMMGVRAAYNISSLSTTPNREYQSIVTYNNFSLVYTYYHDLWGTINLFGIQTGISKTSQGYRTPEGDNFYEVISIPLVSQFHIDFWKMRILINAGCFGGYRNKMVKLDGSSFDEFDNKVDMGFIAGGGLAFIFKPFEIHLEGNYNYSLTYLHNPNRTGALEYQYTHPAQLLISATLNIHF